MFYTYLWLREDGTPYYVGKGALKRAFRKGHPPDRVITQAHPCEAEAFAVEVFLIAHYGRKDLGTGCLRNLTDGGEGHAGPSEATKEKIRKARALHVVSQETRSKMRENMKKRPTFSHKGHKHSEETKKRFGESRKGVPAWNKGVKMSPETCEANRKAHLGIKWKPGRKVVPGHPSTPEINAKISLSKKGKGEPWSPIRRERYLEKINRRNTQHDRSKY